MLLLSLLLLPLIGAVVIAALPNKGRQGVGKSAGKLAVFWSVIPVFLVATIGLGHLASNDGILASWSLEWIPDADISLSFVVDGISWVFLLLTALVTLFVLAISIRFGFNGRGYYALILVMQSMLFGVFTAGHFIPFFLCWEMTLIPSYLLVRLWGGEGAPRAAMRFFIVTLFGGVCMLIGFLALQISVGTMDFSKLSAMAANQELVAGVGQALESTGKDGYYILSVIAFCVFLGLAVKIPVFPFHAWLPDAYAEAPTPVTLLLTGLLSKMGVYGLIRIFMMIFPEVLPGFAPWLTTLAVITVVLGAVAALAQKDMKRILAYSSSNHLGYCVLAVAAVAASTADRTAVSSSISGVILQAFNHGIIASALFFSLGIFEQRTGGLRGIDDFGGLRAKAPVFCGLMGLALFASLGLPGLSGFVGEFLIFNGVFGLVPWAAAVSLIGLLLTAVFLLRLLRKVFLGPLPDKLESWSDISTSERMLFVPVIVLIVLLGIWPQAITHWINEDILRMLNLLITK
ncbi:MAG: NADH-quinone oxidoreductase subunit M [Verrucomicrobiae bacterium]|nr:NADH-quinone oxidoreductase subunit M [Verrucomicrobiae bacterium]NNJ86592.1 NADH-quinone oxidoreductase subunit M [Akkermansiaceae bacterium]